MAWNAEIAGKILSARSDSYYVKPERASEALKKSHRYQLGRGITRRHIAVSRERIEGAVTAYVNLYSLSGNAFCDGQIPGVSITGRYPRGSIGQTGDHGIASSVAALETLDPLFNDVLRLEIDGPSAFMRLLDWYSGKKDFVAAGPSFAKSVAAAALGGATNDRTISATNEYALETEANEHVDRQEDAAHASATFMDDPILRSVVERAALDQAISFYRGEGFTVEEKGKPFDLLCTRPPLVVHVEVKGTTGDGSRVVLTRNEVRDARDPAWRSDLFVVSGVELSLEDGEWVGHGGEILRIEGWSPAEKDLVPTQFDYSVPTTPGRYNCRSGPMANKGQ